MNTDISKAIMAGHEIIVSLLDGSKIAGLPSWGEDRSRVKIMSQDKTVWELLNEIEHVTTLLSINAKTPTEQ